VDALILVFSNEQDCFSGVKKLLSYLPQNNLEDSISDFVSEEAEPNEKILELVPDDFNKGYNMKEIIAEILMKILF
jgi:acetyl-CoA carboxylase carboxyltransferase component